MPTAEQIKHAAAAIMPEVSQFLSKLIQIPSMSGQEQAAMDYLYYAFGKCNVTVEKIPLSDAIKSDPDYSSPIADIDYEGRYNLRVVRKGNGAGRRILLNAHVDTVPPSEGMDDPYSGVVKDGIVYGRGACDDKGPVATIYALFRLLDQLKIDLPGDLIAHLVVEEENGGNGSLAMVRRGEMADFCIVLEPTEGRILTSIRGAVWFKVEFSGKAGHSGQAGQTRSALLMAHEAISLLTEYQRDLLDASRQIELFDKYANPMPITFGRLNAGNWPAMTPNYAVLEGVLGFLPNKTKEQIRREFEETLFQKGTLLNRDNVKLTFTYRHDCSVVSTEYPFVQTLISANNAFGIDSPLDAMTASCDAWFYNNQLDIPTVVYGPGTLKVAHSRDEEIRLSDIADCSAILVHFLGNS